MSHGDSGRASARLLPSPSTHPAGGIYRPSYPRRALAYLATGSLPPVPGWRDIAPLTMPAVAVLLGFLGGRL